MISAKMWCTYARVIEKVRGGIMRLIPHQSGIQGRVRIHSQRHDQVPLQKPIQRLEGEHTQFLQGLVPG